MLAGWGGHAFWCVLVGKIAGMRLQLGSFAVLCFSPRVRRVMHFQGYLSGMCFHDPGKGNGAKNAVHGCLAFIRVFDPAQCFTQSSREERAKELTLFLRADHTDEHM